MISNLGLENMLNVYKIIVVTITENIGIVDVNLHMDLIDLPIYLLYLLLATCIYLL